MGKCCRLLDLSCTCRLCRKPIDSAALITMGNIKTQLKLYN